jgi:FeS assembly protein IscX
MSKRFRWDSVYEIALALIERYPEADLEHVSLQMIFEWVIALPGFDDDPELANDGILLAIFQEWYEELDV